MYSGHVNIIGVALHVREAPGELPPLIETVQVRE